MAGRPADAAAWLGRGLGLVVVGWSFQFVGHHYEGRRPAFVDALGGLLIGPLFIAAELAFMLGLRHELRATIAQRVRPMHGAPAQPATRHGPTSR